MNTYFRGAGLIIKILFIIAASWLLIHIFGFLGLFLAVAYPIWWLAAPKSTVCLFCRAQRDGSYCALCNKKIVKKDGVSPRNLKAAVLNGVIILILSLVSIGVIFIESQVLYKFGFPATTKTASFIIPSTGQYKIGEVFTMKIAIENIDNPINAIQSDIGFDPEKVEIIHISTRDSFAKIFIQKEINNTAGWARLTGGIPNPGWMDTRGTFGIIYFKAKSPGLTHISFLPTSLVLANDGRGTDILKQLPETSYLILPEKISAAEEAKQNEVYSNTHVLGTSTSQEQMVFYNEQRVLGAQATTEREPGKTMKSSMLTLAVNTIAAIDKTIITFWEKFRSHVVYQ